MPRAGGLANFPLEELGKAVVDLAAAIKHAVGGRILVCHPTQAIDLSDLVQPT